MSGTKHDGEKVRTDLLPVGVLVDVSRVLTHGARKYGDHNWRGGFEYSRLFGALLRHLFAWWGGQDRDPETGESHLAHAICCLMFLRHFERTDWDGGLDDRPDEGLAPADFVVPREAGNDPGAPREGRSGGEEPLGPIQHVQV